jgi:DNA repair protein RadC
MTTRPTPIAIGRSRRPSTSVTERVERLGAPACDDEQLLAILLGDGIGAPRLARRLLDRFGTLGAVVSAHPAELRLAGVASRGAARVVASLELARRAAWHGPDDAWLIRTPSDAAEPMIDAMGSLEREELRVLLLDTKNVVVGRRTVYRGNLAGSSVRVGEVFRDAVRACAAAVIVVHNHPSGDPTPSGEDLRITGELAEAGRLLDIELLDHLVIGRGRWVSLRSLGSLAQSPATSR